MAAAQNRLHLPDGNILHHKREPHRCEQGFAIRVASTCSGSKNRKECHPAVSVRTTPGRDIVIYERGRERQSTAPRAINQARQISAMQ
ncbi:CoA transferase [Anopheles sinensis]|uniref:CoA transferase n=1 Tax=Anopheles sinensis TaxID=74873 RepID=A0A084VE66_ANOSI|nr:CoA transferase [Anopheles sinensis]